MSSVGRASNVQREALEGNPTALRTSFLVIRNPNAGLSSARRVEAVVDELRRRGARVTVIATPTADEARKVLSQTYQFDAIVAAGGDGTVRALALAMIEMRIERPLGLIPSGTGNVLANEIGIGGRIRAIADTLAAGPVRDAHVGRANGTPFLLMASSGFDANVLLRLSVSLKQRIGKSAYSAPTLSTLLSDRCVPFDVIIDGTQHQATWAVVANARRYGGRFVIARDASIFDAGFKAVLFKATTRAARLNELLALAAGRLDRVSTVETVSCRHVRIAASGRVPSQIDGDALGFGPVEISMDDRTIPLLVPAASSKLG